MALPPLTALAFCLVISTGRSQGFTVEPAQSDLYVRIGGDAEFTVRPPSAIASGIWDFKSKRIVSWIGTSTLLHAEYKSRVNLKFTSGSLVLRSVDESDNGDYRVTLTAVGSGAQDTATITLKALERVSTPNIISKASSFIEYHDTVVLTCVAAGTAVSYTWLEDNSAIPKGGRLELSASNTTLTITGVLRSDGPFTCRASNPVSAETSEPFHLNVFYGPDNMQITPQSPVTIYNGKVLTLTCVAQSMPSPVYVWLNGTERLFTGPEYIISPVSMDHGGNYTCHVNNAKTGRNISRTVEVIVLTAVPEIPGAVAGIVVGLLVACSIVVVFLIARNTSRPRAEPGTKYEANRSPKGQTTSATDAGNGLETYENLPSNKQGISHAPDGDSTYMGLKLDDRSVYSELHRTSEDKRDESQFGTPFDGARVWSL